MRNRRADPHPPHADLHATPVIRAMTAGEASSIAETRPTNPSKNGSEEHATNAMVAPDLKHDSDGCKRIRDTIEGAPAEAGHGQGAHLRPGAYG
jgi:hypothetical protein